MGVMRRARARPLAAAACLALAPLLAGGCGPSADERCDALCGCVDCSELDYDACLVDTEAAIDTADAYGCDDAYAAWQDCELTKSRCRDDRFFLDGTDCAEERADLEECLANGSSLD